LFLIHFGTVFRSNEYIFKLFKIDHTCKNKPDLLLSFGLITKTQQYIFQITLVAKLKKSLMHATVDTL